MTAPTVTLVSSHDELHTRVARLEQAMANAHLSLAARGLFVTLHGLWDGNHHGPVSINTLEDYFWQATCEQVYLGICELISAGLIVEMLGTASYLLAPEHVGLLARPTGRA